MPPISQSMIFQIFFSSFLSFCFGSFFYALVPEYWFRPLGRGTANPSSQSDAVMKWWRGLRFQIAHSMKRQPSPSCFAIHPAPGGEFALGFARICSLLPEGNIYSYTLLYHNHARPRKRKMAQKKKKKNSKNNELCAFFTPTNPKSWNNPPIWTGNFCTPEQTQIKKLSNLLTNCVFGLYL